MNYNTKSTDAQGKLKPRSVIAREESELGSDLCPENWGVVYGQPFNSQKSNLTT